MGQIGILGIHAHTTLEGTSLVGLYHSLEGIEVAFMMFHLEWVHLINFAPIGIGLVVEHHKFQTHGIIKPSLLDEGGETGKKHTFV